MSNGYHYLRNLVRPTIAHFFASFQTLRRGMQHLERLYRWLQDHNSITFYDDGSPPTYGGHVHPDCSPERSQFLTRERPRAIEPPPPHATVAGVLLLLPDDRIHEELSPLRGSTMAAAVAMG